MTQESIEPVARRRGGTAERSTKLFMITTNVQQNKTTGINRQMIAYNIMRQLPICFMLQLKSTLVTVSLWPLKCLSRVGSDCEQRHRLSDNIKPRLKKAKFYTFTDSNPDAHQLCEDFYCPKHHLSTLNYCIQPSRSRTMLTEIQTHKSKVGRQNITNIW